MNEYFYNSPECVKCILDNMVEYLNENNERTFVYSEIAFFHKWYMEQSDDQKNKIKLFLKEGRLEFVNGGWVMNDEACPFYQDIIDQIRLGLHFLKNEFDITPKVAWFLDPFGHSKTNAALVSKLGFENMVIVRIDYKEKEIRKSNKEMEFIWKPYNTIDDKTSIFTHITYNHYSFQGALMRSFDSSSHANILQRELTKIIDNMSNAYRTKNIMILYGDDFKFSIGSRLFQNMDSVINLYKDSEYEVFYSTPGKYFEEIKKEYNDWPVLKDYDFFPYSDEQYAYWTGYFTSRPYLKGFIRDTRRYLDIFSLFYLNEIRKLDSKSVLFYLDKLTELRKALAVAQHHDAVSGTAKEYVSTDYINKMKDSINDLKTHFKYLFNQNDIRVCLLSISEIDCYDNLFKINELPEIIILNYDILTVYPIRLNIDSSNVKVLDVDNNEINSFDVYCYENKCVLHLLLDFSDNRSYRLIKLRKKLTELTNPVQKFTSNSVEIYENSKIKIFFNSEYGIKYITKEDNKEYSFIVKFGEYKTNTNSDIRPSNYRTGAYIMGPSTIEPIEKKLIIESSYYYDGKYVTEITLNYEWAILKLMIYKLENMNYIIPIKTIIARLPENNREYLMLVQTNIDNINKKFNSIEFFTDTNSLIMTQRIKDYRFTWNLKKDEQVSDNFYPVNYAISIKGEDENMITVFNDRSQAGTSIRKGEIILDINRISDFDDQRGLAGGIYERIYLDKEKHYNHIIAISNKFNQKNISDIIRKKPLLIDNISNQIHQNNINYEDFIITNDLNKQCLSYEIYILDEKRFLLQVTNLFNDPFFTGKINICHFMINENILNKYSYKEVGLNGFTVIDKRYHEFLKFNSFKENVTKYRTYNLSPYEMITFIIEKLN